MSLFIDLLGIVAWTVICMTLHMWRWNRIKEHTFAACMIHTLAVGAVCIGSIAIFGTYIL